MSCPEGELPVGGGVTSDSAYRHGIYIADSGLTLEGTWFGRVWNVGTPDAKTRTATVTAICL